MMQAHVVTRQLGQRRKQLSAGGVQVDAAGQVGQRPGAGLLNLLVKRVGVIPRENMQRCTDLTVYSVLDRHINHGSAEIDNCV